MGNKHKAVLGMCVYQSVKPHTFNSVIEVLRQDRHIKLELEYDDALISRSRNLVATRFLQSKYQVLVFVDDDIYFLTEHFFRLMTLCLNGYDIIGGFYPTRSGKSCASRLAKGISVKVPIKDSKPVEAEYVSTGFMAIHRKVFEKLVENKEMKLITWQETELLMIQELTDKIKNKTAEQDDLDQLGIILQRKKDRKVKLAYADREKFSDVDPYYPFFEAMWYNDEWLSEDWGFCKLAKDVGFKCWLAPDVFLGHQGSYVYTLRDAFRPAIDNTKIIELVRK